MHGDCALRSDATMVSPCEAAGTSLDTYTHLAAFLRGAPQEQIDTLWQTVGSAVAAELIDRGNSPLWVSTAGGGVAWLHVRLDSRPKYYKHAPYRVWEA
jgi:hypothetical protein